MITSAKYLSSVCSSRMTSALTTLRPASIIVANWREKICSDFGLTFLKTVRTPSSPLAGSSLRYSASRPRTRSCSRAASRSGAWTSPAQLETLRVDRAVGVRRHTDGSYRQRDEPRLRDGGRLPIGVSCACGYAQSEGFGLIELLMAMVMLNIGLLASWQRSTRASFALNRAEPDHDRLGARRRADGALPRAHLHRDRARPTTLAGADNTYKCDSALGGSCPNSTAARSPSRARLAAAERVQCRAAQVTGADRKPYRVDTYITSATPTGGRALKMVTVVVRDADNLSARPLARTCRRSTSRPARLR